MIYKAFSGVGGFRTLVQTVCPQAFYMLISWLIFDCETDKNTQIHNLDSRVLDLLRIVAKPSSKGWTLDYLV